MNKLFGLFLLAIASLAPDLAQAAARFAVCATTCTWDNTSTAMWSTTSGGATGASAPTSSDDVTLDAATCVGGTTCTITTFAGTIAINSLTMGACTASTSGCILDANANDTNFTISTTSAVAVNVSGTGNRTLNMGDGTWSLTGNSAQWAGATSTNFTLNANNSTLAFTGTPASFRRINQGGNKTFNIVTVNASSNFVFTLAGSGGVTINTFTVAAPNRINFPAASTVTIGTFTNISSSSPDLVSIMSSDPLSGAGTISSANNWTCDWCAFSYVTFSGGGTFAGTNSYNLGNTTGVTISAPSGGAPTGRIIGG